MYIRGRAVLGHCSMRKRSHLSRAQEVTLLTGHKLMTSHLSLVTSHVTRHSASSFFFFLSHLPLIYWRLNGKQPIYLNGSAVIALIQLHSLVLDPQPVHRLLRLPLCVCVHVCVCVCVCVRVYACMNVRAYM